MSKAKNDAAKALNELRHYLRRDAIAKPLVAMIDRYVGHLRQSVSNQRSELDATTRRLELSRAEVANLAKEVSELKQRLAQETSLLQQVRRNAAAARQEADALLQELEPDDIIPADELGDLKEFMKCFKTLRRRFKRAPTPVATAKITGDLLVHSQCVVDDWATKMLHWLIAADEDSEDYRALVKEYGNPPVQIQYLKTMPREAALDSCRRWAEVILGADLPESLITVSPLSEVVTAYKSHQFEDVGRLVVVCAMLGMPITFFRDRLCTFEGCNDERFNVVGDWFFRWLTHSPRHTSGTGIQLVDGRCDYT